MVLDGGVRAVVSGGALRIQGDALDNQILVEQIAPRGFAVSPQGGTLVNGKAEPQVLFGVRKDVLVSMGAGSDRVEVKGGGVIAGRLAVDTGAGADEVLLSGLNVQSLAINAGAGNDSILIGSGTVGGVLAAKETAILAGAGDDLVRVADSTFKRPVLVDAGGGNDEVALKNVNSSKPSNVKGGAGFDLLSREAVRGNFRYAGFEELNHTVDSLALALLAQAAEGEGVGIAALAVADAATVLEDAIPNTALGNVLLNDPGGVDGNRVVAVNGFAANVGAPVPGQYGTFVLHPDGTFSYVLNNDNPIVNALNDGQTLTDTVQYTVDDGTGTSTGALAITIQGNTDTPPLAAVNDAATVIEDAIPNTALGNVLANDTGGTGAKVVSAVSGFAANVGAPVQGQYGVFQIFANGTFTYLLNNDIPVVNALNAGQTLTDSVPYTMADGAATVTGTLSITIQGITDTPPLAAVNDAAIVAEDAIPNVALGNVLSNDTGGTASKVVTDVRGFAANVGAPAPGQFGYFQIFWNGTYTYILNNDNPAVNALNTGQTLVDSIAYTVTSGGETSTGTLAITIQGNSDTGPLVAVADAAEVFEDTIPNTALGNVLSNDTGGTGAKVVSAVKGFAANVGAPVAGQFGVFQIHPNGTFTYILKNGKAQVNALNDGQTLTDSVAYTVSDGSVTSTGTLVITIQGRNG